MGSPPTLLKATVCTTRDDRRLGRPLMAHAFAGDFASPCIYRILAAMRGILNTFKVGPQNLPAGARHCIGAGTLLHLWHGETENRRYVDRNRELAAFDFDPERDIERDANGLWRWGRRKQGLQGRIGQWLSRGRKGEMRDLGDTLLCCPQGGWLMGFFFVDQELFYGVSTTRQHLPTKSNATPTASKMPAIQYAALARGYARRIRNAADAREARRLYDEFKSRSPRRRRRRALPCGRPAP